MDVYPSAIPYIQVIVKFKLEHMYNWRSNRMLVVVLMQRGSLDICSTL